MAKTKKQTKKAPLKAAKQKPAKRKAK